MKENEKKSTKMKVKKFIISLITITNEVSGARKCDKILSRNERKLSQNDKKFAQNDTIFSQ